MRKKLPRSKELTLPTRAPRMNDLARFAHWCGLELHVTLVPIKRPFKKSPKKP